jgi:hypothetical protein
MTRLVALRNGVATDLDAPDQEIELNLQVEDLSRPGGRAAPFSLTFDMPFTPTNLSFFGFANELSVQTTDFDINKKTEAILYDGGTQVMKGIIQLTSIDVRTRVFKTRFYAGLVDLYATLRGKKWFQVWTDDLGNLNCPLDHVLDAEAVYIAWLGGVVPGTTAPARTIQYPLTDNGGHLFADGRVAADYLQFWNNIDETLRPSDLHPAIKVSYLIDEMLRFAGYARSAALTDFFNDPLQFGLYCIVGTQRQYIDNRPAYGFRGACTIDTTSAGQTLQNWLLVPWDFTSAGYYDTESQWVSNLYWVPPQSGVYFLEFTISHATNLNGQWNSFLRAFQDSDGVQLGLNNFSMAAAGDGPLTVTMQIEIPANYTDNIYFEISTSADVPDLQVVIFYANLVSTGGDDFVLDFATIMGDESLDAWLKGVVETFNLVLDINESTKVVEFREYDEYIVSGGDIDWTKRLNEDGPMMISPATEYQKARVKLTPAQGEDHRNRFYEGQFGQRKGQIEVINDSDFATEEIVLGDFFGLWRSTYLKYQINYFNGEVVQTDTGTETPLIVMDLWQSLERLDTVYESNPPILCYYHGYQNLPSGFRIRIDGEAADYTAYAPLFTSYSNIPNATNIVSLEYATSAPDLASTDVIGTPTAGLFQTYWVNYFNQIYGNNARIVECEMFLSALDIFQINWGAQYRIKNLKFRLLAISNYVVGGTSPVKVKLFKTSEAFDQSCQLTPQIGFNGIVRWVDANGQSAVGTKFCCQSYGWLWLEDRNLCSAFARRTDDQTSNYSSFATPGPARMGGGVSSIGNRQTYDNYLSGSVGTETWDMVCQTVGATAVAFTAAVNSQIDFLVANERTVNIQVDWLAVRTRGGTVGESSSGEDVFLLSTISSSSTKYPGSIYSRGTTGLGVDLISSDSDAGSKFRFNGLGIAGEDWDWFMTVTIVEYDASRLFLPPTASYGLFQNNDVIEWQDGTEMEWNA